MGQYFLITRPELFPIYYFAVVVLCVASRVVHFKSLGYEYFLLDFCYCLIAASFVFLLFFPRNENFFKLLFIFANGPLPFALIVYRNSLVFHDFDRVTSVAVHLFPSMMTYACRWSSESVIEKTSTTTSRFFSKDDYTRALSFYIAWQFMYFLKTEITDRAKLDTNPNLQTSLRYLTGNASSINRLMLSTLRCVGVYGKTEEFNSRSKKTKVVFIASQLLFTLVSATHTSILYNCKEAHIIFIVVIYAISLFYGAGYYVEIFSRRYYEGVLQRKSLKQMGRAVATFVLESTRLESTTVDIVPFSPTSAAATKITPEDTSPPYDESSKPLIGEQAGCDIVKQVISIIEDAIDCEHTALLIGEGDDIAIDL